MFKKLVVIEPVGLIPPAIEELDTLSKKVVLFDSIPANDQEMIKRINDADAVLLSYTSYLGKEVLKYCSNLKYIGMCNSLYSPESANVDIEYAHSKGITVTGIRDYGDEGVVEYVISELVRCLHGFWVDKAGNRKAPWRGKAREITDLKVGIIGLGKSGGLIADALHFLGASISYYSRSQKKEAQQKGHQFMELHSLLSHNEVLITCLNRNTILLHQPEFEVLGTPKILFNTGLSPAWDDPSFERWLAKDNVFFCDSYEALGDQKLLQLPNVHCMGVSSGRTSQAFVRLSQKVLQNISEYNRRGNIS